MSPDKAHFEMTGISKFGLVEMTRERMRPAFQESIHRKCELCGGTGVVKSDEMVAVTALREIHMQATKEGTKGITCRLPIESMNYMINTWRPDIAETEKEFGVPISLLVDAKLLPGQYKVEAERAEPPKEQHRQPHKEQPRREQKQAPQKQPVTVGSEQAEALPEQEGRAAESLPIEVQEQKRRRKRRPRRGRKHPRKEEGALPEAAEGPAEKAVTDPIQEGI
jgi:ribonuclease E